MYRFAAMATSLLLIAPNSVSQETAAASPPAPCSQDAYNQFDFWLGEWEVINHEGLLTGFNEITKEENGCLVLETWSAIIGGTGQSYNYYNPATQKWRQVWISPGLIIDYEGGLTESGSMKLAGEITYPTSKFVADFTGEWTLNEDGTVTQHLEQYDAEKGEWVRWFTGTYTRLEPTTP